MFTICYTLLIIVAILFSWVGNIYGLLLPDGEVLPNLLSEESVRWFVRNSMDHISAAPWPEILLTLISIGALRSSGILSALRSREIQPRRYRHALRVSLVVLALCVCIVLIGILPGGNLLSVMGHLPGSPFASGWPLLLSMTVCGPCMVYGYMAGLWRSKEALLAGLSSELSSCASCLFTCVVASLLMAALRYIRLFELLGLSPIYTGIVGTLVYALPLIVSIIKNRTAIHETSTTE